MGRLGLGVGRRGRAGPSGLAPLKGFALNGSANPALRAMLARVAAGSGRGRIVFKGDSTTMGAGAGGTGDVAAQLAGAAPGRPSAALARRLTAAGLPTRDAAVVGDGGCGLFGVALPAYDPRVSFDGPAWGQEGGASNPAFAGGNYLFPSTGVLRFAETCDRFELVCYGVGGTFGFAVDGAVASGVVAPGAVVSGNEVTMPGGGGFTRVTVPAGARAAHVLGVVKRGAATPLLRSVMAYDGGAGGIDILNHASAGASSAQQAAAGNGWSNLDALGFDRPDLTIVNLGLNDAAQGVVPSAYAANLRALIDTAKLSGDVLLVSPHPADPAFAPTAAQVALRDAAASLAAAGGVAHMDLRAYFGSWSAIASRSADGLVHGNAGFYEEVGEVYRRCVAAMAA